jgi:hypothetical protein
VENPYLKRSRGTEHGRAAEKKAAKRLKGRLTPGSGALAGAKGDIVKVSFLIESKATKDDSISLKLSWLDKIAKEALDVGKDPALILQFVDALGNRRKGGGWVLIPERLFKEIAE